VFDRLRAALRERQNYLPDEITTGAVGGHVVSGSLWSGAGLVVTTLLQFVRGMIFARLLPPAAFGALNLANVFTQFILIFANFGFNASVVYWRRLNRLDLSTCWWGNLMVDVGAAALCCIFAFTGTRFLDSPEVKWVIVLLSVQFVIASVGSIHAALMNRQFQFKQTALVGIWTAAATFAVGWFLVAVLHWGVFGLIGGGIAGTAVTVVLQCGAMRWLPSRDFSWQVLKEHANYGRWFLAVNLVTFGNQNIDRAMIGTTLSNTQLGYYDYASNLPMQVTIQLSTVLNSVLFPAFANLRENLVELRRVLLRVMRYNTFIIYPLLTGLLLTTPDFVQVVYGPTWAPIVGPTRIFCLFGMLRVLINSSYSLCNGVGKPHLPFKWSLIALPFNLAILWWSLRVGGLMGVSLAKLFLPAFMLFTLVVEITRLVGMPIRQIGLSALPATVCCLTMGALVLAVQRVPGFAALPALPRLLLQVLAGMGAYLGALRLFYPADFKDLLALARRVVPGRA
jgi:O-antigen/teichoic acid export membrane protein